MDTKSEQEKQRFIDKRDSHLFRISHQIADLLSRIPVRGSLFLGQIISRILIGKAKSSLLIKTRYGFDMFVSPQMDCGIDKTLALTGTTERGTLHVMQQCLALHSEPVIFDVGANIGLMTLFSSKTIRRGGEVFAFEPVSETYKRLIHNVDLNGAKNIKLFNIALGSEETSRKIYVNQQHTGMSTLLYSKNSCECCQNVEIKTVDCIVNAYGLQKVDFVKIDVEGWELEVLKGASKLLQKKDAPVLMLEYCSERPLAGGNHQNLLEFIKKVNSYQIFILKDGEYRVGKLIKIDDSKQLPKFTNLFCFLQKHLKSMPSSLFSDH